MHLVVLAGSTQSSTPALVEKLVGSLELSKIYVYLILLLLEASHLHLLWLDIFAPFLNLNNDQYCLIFNLHIYL